MKIVKTIAEVKEFISICRSQNKTIGFVPTMGALHKGHISLVEESVKECGITFASIFVNPIQFNNTEDLKKYPRTLENDLSMLEAAGCDLVFVPEVKEMYPDKVTKKYEFGDLEKVMEGEFRPGHFNGVAVVVNMLFDILEPNKAYFGEKDFQQLAIIKRMVEIDKMNVDVRPCNTIREEDGLAMSSRNLRLSEVDRKEASLIYKVLNEVKATIKTSTIDTILNKAKKTIVDHNSFELEYVDIVDIKTLQHVDKAQEGEEYVVCIAAWLGGVRLIDNMILIS